MEKNRTDPGLHRWFIPAIRPGSAIDSTHITFSEVFSIFFMQHWGKIFAGYADITFFDEPKRYSQK
jgi:hypothetical protein